MKPSQGEERFLLLAVEESDNSVGFYDSTDGTEVGRVRLSLWPHEIAVAPDGLTAFVSNFGLRDYDLTIGHAGNSVSAINIAARWELDRYYTCSEAFRYWGPHGVKVSPDGASLYVNVERVTGLREPDPTAAPGQEVTKMLVYDIATKALKRTFNIMRTSPIISPGSSLATKALKRTFNIMTEAPLGQGREGDAIRGRTSAGVRCATGQP